MELSYCVNYNTRRTHLQKELRTNTFLWFNCVTVTVWNTIPLLKESWLIYNFIMKTLDTKSFHVKLVHTSIVNNEDLRHDFQDGIPNAVVYVGLKSIWDLCRHISYLPWCAWSQKWRILYYWYKSMHYCEYESQLYHVLETAKEKA